MDEKVEKPCIPVRTIQAIMLFLGVIACFLMRINISVGIVAMTSNSTNSDYKLLLWDTQTKTIILSSYFWGYMVLQIPAGMFCQKYGPKKLLFIAVLLCGITTLFTPVLATHLDWKFVVASRVVQGLGQGVVFPSIYGMAAKWSPPYERNQFFTYAFSGTQVGTVMSLLGAGYLAAGPGGWPSIFYLSGSIGIAWSLLWLYVGANSPSEHKSISQQERVMIESSLVHSSSDTHKLKIPWLEITRSVPMWALLIAHFCQNWGFWTLLTLMPSYLGSALHFNIKNNGLLSSLPYLLMWIFNVFFSKVADTINKKKLLSLSTAKKMWNTIGMWLPAAALLGVTMTSSLTTTIILLVAAIALNFGIFFGFLTNHLDLAPNFASILLGLTNSLSNSASFIAPLVAGAILKDESDINQWNTVFYIIALIFVIGNIVFLIFGTAELQTWNGPKETIDDKIAEIPLTSISKSTIVKNGRDDKV
uniref:Putative inorganic phosphate cotransporter n=1 Tax=Clastoptera arizonana TaxID=38151 RepID=A0A1B6CYE8_9HEMI